MTRFAALKHQRAVSLAKDMNAAADEIVKLRNQARRESTTPPNCAPKNSYIRVRFGLLEDTPLHDVTRRGSPHYQLRRATRGLVEQDRPQLIAHRLLRHVARVPASSPGWIS